VFECSKLNGGYLVDSYGYFFINEKDGEQLDKSPIKISITDNVLNLLLDGEMAACEIYNEYLERFNYIGYPSLNVVIQYLRRIKRITRCKERVKNTNGRLNYKWKLKTQNI
jgi:hypothetical protein